MKTIRKIAGRCIIAIKKTAHTKKYILSVTLLSIFIIYGGGSNAQPRVGRSSHRVNVPPFEKINIYRIQLEITTCNNEDAGTDNDVYVQMNEGDEKFYLDKSVDDFRKGHSETYDILS